MQTWIEARGGIRLFVRKWPCERALGTVLVVHGLGEHIGRHEGLAERLLAHRWRVVGYDLRGHGQSGGGRGDLQRADDLLVDLAQVLDAVRAEAPGPLLLLGHSMGGVVAASFVAGALTSAAPPAWWRPVDGLVLSSPALATGMGSWKRLLLALLGPLAPHRAMSNGLDAGWISRDPAVVAAYRADPLVHDRITPRLVRFIVDAGLAVLGAAPRWAVPTLLLYAGQDRCVDPAGSDAFASAAPADVLTAHRYPALFHEIFHEPEQAEVLSALGAWLDTLASLPPGARHERT